MAEESINQVEVGTVNPIEVEGTQTSNAIEVATVESQTTESRKRKASSVWEHFTKSTDPKVTKVKCNYCVSSLVYRSKDGTTLWKHLKSCSGKQRHDRIKAKGQTQLSVSGASNDLSTYRFDQARSREDVARFLIMCEMPFSTIDHWAFRTMLANLRPEFKQHKRMTVTSDCIKLYVKEKEYLKDIIASNHGRISLTTDTWTSCQTKGYMSLTAHYVDNNWKLQKKILNFMDLDERHTGVILSLALEKCISDWNIDEKLFSITMDNCSSNNVVARLLKEQFNSSLPHNGDFFHIRCSAHILNLIVKEGLKDIDASIVRIRDAAKFVTSSPQRLKIFNEFLKKMKLDHQGRKQRLDCPTRWNSTYHMLERAIECKKAFSNFHLVENFKKPPLETDWSSATEICKFLKVFDDSTNVFSASKVPTSNLYFYQVCMIDLHLKSRWDGSTIESMQRRMQEKFSDYWKNYSMILSIAVIFDPRHKFNFVAFFLRKVYGANAEKYVDEVRRNLQSLFEWYAEKEGPSKALQRVDSEVREFSNMPPPNEELMQEYYAFMETTKRAEPSKSELELYLEEKVHPSGACFDVLDYWSINEVKYPILASIARDVLAIPVSTVASESAFSTGSRVVSDERSCLKASTIEALICAQDWMRGNVPHDEDIDLGGFVDEGCDEEESDVTSTI